MKNYNRYYIYGAMALMLVFLSGCELVANIFSAGLWVGIILTVLVVALVIWLIIKVMKGLRK